MLVPVSRCLSCEVTIGLASGKSQSGLRLPRYGAVLCSIVNDDRGGDGHNEQVAEVLTTGD